MVPAFLLLGTAIAAGFSAASPANDWNKPCFDGECAYEIHPSVGTSGVIKLRGSSKSITDITPAAGWVILDCNPNTLVQDIRLVCKSDEVETDCNHVFAHHGPVNKLVRLPESCGDGPFARIASARIAEDQSLPSHMERTITRRDGLSPVVHILSIDLNYDAVDISQTGEVKFGFQGINIPDYDANFEFTEAWWDDAWSWIKGAAKTVAKGVTTAAKAVAKVATDAWETVKKIPKIIHDATHYKIDSQVVPKKRIGFSGHKTVLDIKKEGCGPISGHLKADISGKGYAEVTVAVIIEGHVIPPSIDKFATFADISGDVNGKIHFNAGLAGGVDSGRKTIFDVGIPGLTIPGIFALGPHLEIEAQGRAYLELELDVQVDLSYHLDHMQIWFPKSAGKIREKSIMTKETPFSLSASANLEANALIEGHIIPAVKFGITIGPKVVEASLLLEADAFARLNLHAEANAKYTNSKRAIESAAEDATLVNYVPPYGSYDRELAIRSTDELTAGFSGCVWLDCGVVIRAGVTGKFLKWKGDATTPLWTSPTPVLFKKCWALGKDSPSISHDAKTSPSKLEKNFLNKNQKCGKGSKPASVVKNKKIAPKKISSA